MPTYEYACTSCGHRFEAHQSFSDDPLTTCPECGAALRKVFGSVGIVLKGPGFYRTDSRNGSSTLRPSKETGSKDTSAEKSASGAGDPGSGNGSSNASGTSGNGTSAAPSSGSSAVAAKTAAG